MSGADGNGRLVLVTGLGLAIAAAYCIGSIPFGYLTARLIAGIDIREHGSRNIGATNVGRVLGKKWGIFVLALDFFKGLLPTWLLPQSLIALGMLPASGSSMTHAPVACGVATIIGHMYPCWLRLRGGKGVATGLGVAVILSPWGTLLAAVLFVAAFRIWRIVSLGSILAVIAFACFQLARAGLNLFSADNWSLTAFSLGIPALIIYQHRTNIRRLLRAEEAQYRTKESVAADETNAPSPPDK